MAQAGLAQVLDAVPDGISTVVHCCAADVPVQLIRGAGASGVGLDVGLLDDGGWSGLADAVESGLQLWAGVLPTGPGESAPGSAVSALLRRWDEVGLDPELLASAVLTPACGLAGATPAVARRVQRAAVEAADALAERLA